LWIASPYFVPDPPVFEALQLAALRGVDVRILLPAKPDHKLVYLASFSFLEVADRTFARQAATMLERDFQQARRISAADLRGRGWLFRWAVWAARLFDPIL
jgi:cardiolipin synthase